MPDSLKAKALGLDFGTTNTVAALGGADGSTKLVRFGNELSASAVLRSALCFWQDERSGSGSEFAGDDVR